MLLDRLARSARDGEVPPPPGDDLHALMESVRQHLNVLLNARHGMCEALADYGLPAMSDLLSGSGNHIQMMSDAIRNCVEKYEPRLKRVRVTCQRQPDAPQRQVLTFRIEASLVNRNQEHRVWYETAVRGSGEFDVVG